MLKAIPANIKKKLNSKIYIATKGIHNQIPLQDVFDILESTGYVPLQEDNTHWSGFFCGAEGMALISIGNKSTMNNNGEFVQMKNDLFCSWYKYNTDKYEFVCYVS